MTAPVTELTRSYLLSILSYNPNSGEFRWKVSRGRVKAGYIAGKFDTYGYLQIIIDGKPYTASRLAWFYMRGEWPVADVGYIDNNRANTAWDNLRLQQRSAHRLKELKQSDPRRRARRKKETAALASIASEYTGVVRAGQSFRAKVHVGPERKTISLGYYDTIEEAAEAVRAYKAQASTHV